MTDHKTIVGAFREAIDGGDFERAWRYTTEVPVWRVFASKYEGKAGIERVMSYAD